MWRINVWRKESHPWSKPSSDFSSHCKQNQSPSNGLQGPAWYEPLHLISLCGHLIWVICGTHTEFLVSRLFQVHLVHCPCSSLYLGCSSLGYPHSFSLASIKSFLKYQPPRKAFLCCPLYTSNLPHLTSLLCPYHHLLYYDFIPWFVSHCQIILGIDGT